MAEEQALEKVQPKLSLVATMASEYSMEPAPFMEAIKQVVFPAVDRKGNAPTNAQMVAYLAVAHQYHLNPFTRQLWPFPMKDGGFVPVTAFDGWLYAMNEHPQYDGDEYVEEKDDKGNLVAGVLTIYRKDRQRPIVKRCTLREWKRDTPTWNQQPAHMLELRTYCQGIRKAFGISGLYDIDDAEAMNAVNITGESVVMERTTNERTEQLKEKIGAKKEEKAKKAEAKAPETPPTVEIPLRPLGEIPPEEPPQENEPPFDLEPPEAREENGNKVISERERKELLDVLKAKTTEANKDAIMKAVRKHLFDLGYTNTKEIQVKNLAGLMEWAKALNV